MKLTLSRAAEFMPATGEFAHDAVAAGYSIDSRTLQPGDLFFAVRGERLDGHDYVEACGFEDFYGGFGCTGMEIIVEGVGPEKNARRSP